MPRSTSTPLPSAEPEERALRYWPAEGQRATLVALLALIAVIRAGFEVWFYRANFGFTATFGDDVMRVLTAFVWLRSPELFPHTTLLPLQFWLLGGLIKLVGHPWRASLALQNAACWCSLGAIWLICCELFPGEYAAAALAVALAAFHPAHVVYSLGAMQIPFLDATVLWSVFFLLRFRRGGRRGDLLVSASFMLAATMVHYDGWLFAMLYTLALLADWKLKRGAQPGSFFGQASALALVWSFVPVWLLFQWRANGTPLFYVWNQSDLRAILPLLGRVTGPFVEFAVVFPMTTILAAGAIAASWWRGKTERLWYLLFPVGEVVLMVPLHVIHVVLPYCHYTHLWTDFMLLAPWAAWAMAGWAGRWKSAVAAVAILALAPWDAWRLPGVSLDVSNFSASVVKLAALIDQEGASGLLAARDRVMLQIYQNDTEYEGRIWELPLLFLIQPSEQSPYGRSWNTPLASDRIIFDRRFDYTGRQFHIHLAPGDPSVLDLPSAELAQRLKRDDVRVLIVHTDKAALEAARVMREAAELPPYRLFVNGNDAALAMALAQGAARLGPVRMPWRR